MVKNILIVLFIMCGFTSFIPEASADIAPPQGTHFDAYINKKGHFVIRPKNYEPVYDDYSLYISSEYKDENGEIKKEIRTKEGLALKYDSEKGLWGFVDDNDEWKIEPKFPATVCQSRNVKGGFDRDIYCSSMTYFSEGLAAVKYDEKFYGTISGGGLKPKKYYDVVIPDGFEYRNYQSNAVWGYEKDGKLYVVTADNPKKPGLEMLYLNYEYKKGYIDKEGNIVIKTPYRYIFPFHDGMAKVCDSRDNCGYINKEGKTVIKPKFYSAGNFSNGVAKVSARTRTVLFPFSLFLLILVCFNVFLIKRDMKK